MVKPAGTGTPSWVISARPIPLPPRSSRPPADDSSKSKTYLVMGADLVIDSRKNSPQIVGLGGYPADSMLDYVLGLARGRKVLYVGTAGMENPYSALDWHEQLGASVLRFSPWPPDDLRAFTLEHDVILVGGGNTANMLAVWRAHGFDKVLRDAWQSGVVLAGWSAGMICWFEAGVTDSFGPELTGMHDGLGFLS